MASGAVPALLAFIDICQLVFSALFLVWFAICCFYVWRFKGLRFNLLWSSRLGLCGLALVWVVASFFNNTYLFNPKDGIAARPTPDQQTSICLWHIVLTYGLAEPAFLLIVLYLVKSKTSPLLDDSNAPNKRILFTVIAGTLPHLTLTILIAILNSSMENTPRFVILAYNDDLKVCSIPLFSVAAIGVAILVFITTFNVIGFRLAKRILNKRLIARLNHIRILLSVNLVIGLFCRIIILFYEIGAFLDKLPKGEDGKLAVVFLRTIYFFGFLGSITFVLWILVLRPVIDSAQVPLTDARHDDTEREPIFGGPQGQYLAGPPRPQSHFDDPFLDGRDPNSIHSTTLGSEDAISGGSGGIELRAWPSDGVKVRPSVSDIQL